MTNRLKQYFPMLRTRTEIMEIILKDKTLKVYKIQKILEK